MVPKEYIENALKTAPKKYDYQSFRDITPEVEHAAMGLVTEAGELMDAIKKTKFYGEKLDKVNLIEEAGDIMWYLAVLADDLGVSFEDIWDKNIRKLKKRYSEKFNKKEAWRKNRNLNSERKELEK